jgi:hypothetical protein
LADLRPGDKVTFHIYSDGQAGGSVLPFAERWNQPEDLAGNVQLPSGRPARPRPAHPGYRRLDLAWILTTLAGEHFTPH